MAHGEAAAAIRKAIKASGVVMHVEPAEFSNILSSPRVGEGTYRQDRAGLKLRQERDIYSVQSPPLKSRSSARSDTNISLLRSFVKKRSLRL